MRIIRQTQTIQCVKYTVGFEYVSSPGAGFVFDANEQFVVDTASLTAAALENYQACMTGSVRGKVVSGPKHDKTSYRWHEPRAGRCDCGTEVILDMFTNTCDGCGTDYNMSGHALAPREQWGTDTGETLSDILMVDGSDDGMDGGHWSDADGRL